MVIRLHRKWLKKGYSIGILYINGERVCETLEDADRGLREYDSLDEIRKKKIPGETAIPVGCYQVTWTYSPRFRKMLPLLNNVPGYSGVRIHCLTPDTEILTENGWQNLESFENNPAEYCYSYNTETGMIELTPVNFMVKDDYEGKLYCNEGRRVNYSVTDKHKMYVGSKRKDGSHIWGFREADSIPHNATQFRTAALRDGEDIYPHQKTFYRLLMATVADGYILNRSATSSQVRFHFTKDRKIERIKSLVEELGGTYVQFVDCEGKTHIQIDKYLSEMLTEVLNPYRVIQKDKTLPWFILNLKGEDLRDLVLEYLFWDGRYENYLKNKKNMVISCTNQHNLDILQAMATLGGLRAYMKDESGNERYNNPNCSPLYALVLYDNQDVVVPDPDTYSTKEYKGTVWCLNNDNHTLIIRKNKRPLIIGNCGNRAKDTEGCILCGTNTEPGVVTNSRYWTNKVCAMIEAAAKRKEGITITIHY